MRWERTTTEWMMIGNEGLPARDAAFYTGEPIRLADKTFAKGIGTSTPSDIVYRLDGNYSRFEVQAGVEDDGGEARPGVRFLVFLDGIEAFQSAPQTAADPPLAVELPLLGVNELRLVTMPAEGSTRGARAAWADARIVRGGANDAQAEAFAARLQGARRAQDALQASQQAALDREALQFVQSMPAGGPGEGAARVGVSTTNTAVQMANGRVAVSVGLGGQRNAMISVLDVSSGRYVAKDLASSVRWNGGSINLHSGTVPSGTGSTLTLDVSDPVLGEGRLVRTRLTAREYPDVDIDLDLTLFANSSALLYRISLERLPPGAGGPIEVDYVDAAASAGFAAGKRTHYLADMARLQHVIVTDDDVTHRDRVAWGKPVYAWDEQTGTGFLLALLDETALPPVFTMRQGRGRALAQVGFSASQAVSPGGSLQSAELYLEPTPGRGMQQDFGTYRALLAARFPPAPLPAWFKYQWLSWYVYYMDISEDALVQQIDYIADHLADLGPWHIIVDAGWYIAEGRPGSDWQHVDTDKFPHGLRWLVDYAHRRGVKVVLYFTAPYLNSREEAWDWLGLKTLVDEHPDWLIPLDDSPPYDDYVYDFQNPGLRAYLAGIMRDFWVNYGVDGMKLDGLGGSGDAVVYSEEGSQFVQSDRAISQTLDIYRFVYEQAMRYNPDAYIESGWITPVMANPYAQTFRYGDEEPVFSRPYPLPGLVEHIDYAAYQQGLLGQRANMGAAYGDPNESIINQWWLGAGLALGTQTVLSVYLPGMTDEALSAYRALLAPYEPFTGTTIVDAGLEQQVFSTRRDDVWYAGVLNRTTAERMMSLDTGHLGLPDGAAFAAYDTASDTIAAATERLNVSMGPESFRLFVVRQSPGLLWTNSRVAEQAADAAGELRYRVTAPPTVDGFLKLYAPGLTGMEWDGGALPATAAAPEADASYSYDQSTGLLSVWYASGGVHTLAVHYKP